MSQFRETLRNEFLSLARAFSKQNELLMCMDCALKALWLDPQSDEARHLAGQAATGAPGKTQDAGLLSHLHERKKQVEVCLRNDPGLCAMLSLGAALPGPEASPPPQDTAALLGPLQKRLQFLKEKLSQDRSQRRVELRQRLEELIERLKVEEKSLPENPDAKEAEATQDLFSELSLEHELHNVGNDFYRASDFDRAIECYSLALEERPELLESHFNRALAHTRMGNYPRATEDLLKVIELNPNLSEAHYTLGLVEEYQGRFDRALERYEKALEIDPDYVKAKNQTDVARRKLNEAKSEKSSGPSASPSVTDKDGRMNDFSCFREKPECGFSEVSNQHVKREFRKVAAFLRGDQAFADWGCEPPRGVLLYGPPGTGKTLLARALAAEVSCPFYAPPSTVFLNLWYGNTEHHLRTLWTQASAHPEGAIIFLDEFDALGSRRSRLANPTGNEPQVATVGCLLELMGGLRRSKSRLVVIAATNRLDNIDPAFLRPGRFDFTIEVPRPTELELAEILLIHLRKVERRARRLDVLTPELQEWIRTTRVSALSEAGDWTGQEPPRIREMARIAARHRMVGAHVDEWVRRVVFDRAVSQAEKGDPGPIGCEDLQRELDALIKERLEHLEDKPWFSEELQGGKN